MIRLQGWLNVQRMLPLLRFENESLVGVHQFGSTYA